MFTARHSLRPGTRRPFVEKNASARAAIRQAGAEVWDLPLHSPALNPVEKMWSKIKTYVRKAKARKPQAPYRAIADAMDQVIYEEIQGWFASHGYTLFKVALGTEPARHATS